MTLRRDAGFTLIELIIGLTLTGLIVTLLIGGLRLAGTGAEAADTAGEQSNQIRIVHTLLLRELQAVYPYRWKKTADFTLGFRGASDAIRFFSNTPPRAGTGGLQRVELALIEGEDGLSLIMRRQFPIPGQRDFDGLEDAEKVVLLAGLETASFQYYGSETPAGKAAWLDKWEDPQRLPRLVRLSLRAKEAAPWPDVVVALRVNEWSGCTLWDLATERCWG